MTRLRPMRRSVFPAFVEAAVASYAEDNVNAECWTEAFEPYRKQGHAKAALRQAAALAAADGHARIELHVFRHNTLALGLYASVGFETASLSLTMPLSGPESNPSKDDLC